MQTSPALLVRQLLIDAGVGSTGGTAWPVIAGPFPLTGGADNMVSVQDTGGWQRGRIQRTGQRDFHPTVVVTVRSPSYPLGYQRGALVEAAFDVVGTPAPYGDGPVVVTVGGTGYQFQGIHVMTSAQKVGEDEEKRRQLFTVNARMTVSPVVFSLHAMKFGETGNSSYLELV